MTAVQTAKPLADAGSFRDRNGRIYVYQDRVYRGLSQQALDHFRALQGTRFYSAFSATGEIIGSDEIATPGWAPADATWAGWLEHQRVPFISYPYEWTFSMLRDAAVLQLRLLEAALQEGWTMKDASPYNVQFIAGRPVFIDVPSFEPLAPGSPWNGYRQFCELNLFPLMLQAYKGLDFQPLLRARIDGVPVQTAAKLFGWRDLIRPGVFSHVWLQALLERKYSSSSRDLRSELGSAGFGRELLLANVRKLLRLVPRLRWQAAGSEWADYADFHNYSDADHEAKSAFVEQAVQACGARLTWDLGCNTGKFSSLAAQHCQQVVAMDADHLAVERLYADPDANRTGHILPLVQNLTDPSPSWGWNHCERKTLEDRGRPDLVLCLALLHHVVIGANIPADSFVAWLAGLDGFVVIEFVSRDDDKVQQLLLNRVEPNHEYTQEYFERCLVDHFEIVDRLQLGAGRRTLYYCRPNPAAG